MPCVKTVDTWWIGSGVGEGLADGVHDGDAIAIEHLGSHDDGLGDPDGRRDHIGNCLQDLLIATIAEPGAEAEAEIENEFDSNGKGEESVEDGVTCGHYQVPKRKPN